MLCSVALPHTVKVQYCEQKNHQISSSELQSQTATDRLLITKWTLQIFFTFTCYRWTTQELVTADMIQHTVITLCITFNSQQQIVSKRIIIYQHW